MAKGNENQNVAQGQPGTATDVNTGAQVKVEEVPNNNSAPQQNNQQQTQAAQKQRLRDKKWFKLGVAGLLLLVAEGAGAGAAYAAGKKKGKAEASNQDLLDTPIGSYDPEQYSWWTLEPWAP